MLPFRLPSPLAPRHVVLAMHCLLLSCSSLKQAEAVPEGLTCSELLDGGTDASALEPTLASAPAGSCVIVSGEYKGAFVVPPGVTVASPTGKRAIFHGTDAKNPALLLQGAKGSGLQSVSVLVSQGIGVAIRGGPVVVRDVTVEQAASAAMTVSPPSVACTTDCDGSEVSLTRVSLRASKLGLFVRGMPVAVRDSDVSDNTSRGALTGGGGIVATEGARLLLLSSRVERNDGIGVLLDGERTQGMLENATVSFNSDRGIWAQKLAGSLENPSLVITGADTVIDSNRFAGVGAIRSRGLLLRDALIRNTIATVAVTHLAAPGEQVGDGLGLYDRTGAVTASALRFQQNGRAAALIDSPSDAVTLAASLEREALGVVVQRATIEPTVDQALRSTPERELGVSAPQIGVVPYDAAP